MSAGSVKWQRTDAASGSAAAANSSDVVPTALKVLPIETLRAVLSQAAQQHADVALALTSAYENIVTAEQGRVIDFEHVSKAAWRVLNITYRRLPSSRQYEMAGEAAGEVRRCVRAVGQASRAPASFGTRRGGLETLRKIGKSLALAGSAGETLGHEVAMAFRVDPCLETAMLRIARAFTPEERAAILRDGEFEAKLKELEELGRDECIFDKLGRVREVLFGVDSGATEDDREEDYGEGEIMLEYRESSESSESEDSEEEEEEENDDDDGDDGDDD